MSSSDGPADRNGGQSGADDETPDGKEPAADRSRWGTIYSQGREQTLGGIEQTRSTAWTPQDEAAYLERVREKAAVMAAGLLNDARAEAEEIREQARQEGYNQGLDAAKEELDAFRAGMGESVSSVLSAIEGQCSHIFTQWREDILEVARLAVEAVTATALSGDHRDMLERLIVEAVAVLEKRRELLIRVNPEDEAVVGDIVALVKEGYSDVHSWRVKADPGISAGGLIVESESSLAEGRLESRKAAVRDILASLTLPGTP